MSTHLLDNGTIVNPNMTTFESKLTPEERIPPEVLVQVFALAVGNEPAVFPPDFSCPHWVLSRVCRQWRSIVLNESRLWSRIEVSPVDESAVSKMVAFINIILPSKGPISIAARETPTKYNSLFIMEQLVITYLPRIRELQLNLGPLANVQLFRAPPELFTFIETLEISIPTSLHREDEHWKKTIHAIGKTQIFTKAHRLRNLRLVGGNGIRSRPLALVLLHTCIPWHQLVSFEFRSDELDAMRIHSILSQSPILQTFGAVTNGSWREENTDDIIHPHLHSLRLWLGRSSVLRPLILPALKYLHLDGLLTSSSYTEISHMLSRSDCSLDVFEGRGRVGLDVQAMAELMSSMPTVQRFIGDTLWVDDAIFTMIGRGELLPCVSHLTCGVDTTGAFVEALETRVVKATEAGTMVTHIQVAVGLCPRWYMCSEMEKAEADAKLNALNEKYGVQYSMEWITVLSE